MRAPSIQTEQSSPPSDADDQLHSIDTRVRSYFDRIAPGWDSYVASAYEVELEPRRMLHQQGTVPRIG